MSLFGGGAECSTSRNPLAQFTKHTGEDRSLQRPGLTNQAPQQGIRDEVRMSQRDQQHMNRFMTPQDNFNFQGMYRELPKFQPQQQPVGGASWSGEFEMQKHPQFQQSATPMAQSSSAWSSEFAQSQQSSSSPSLRNASAYPSFIAGTPVLANRALSRPMFQPTMSMRPVQTSSQGVEVESMAQWEDKFKEIDAEMAHAMSKQEGKQIDLEEQKEKGPQEEDIVIDDKYQANFDEVWKSLHEQNEVFDQQEPSWEKDFATYAQARSNFGQYKFEQQNQFMGEPNAYEIGLMLMENGAKLSEAALAFEAAIQEQPDHVDAWLKLGEVQTQNEKEIAGLTALEKCLSLDPKNLSALMTLAVSYINEGYDNAAFATLERWIETKYPQISERARSTNPAINDEDRYTLHKRVTELFLQAAQLSPTGANIDADVQMGLGVLFYANDDFSKTIDCFKAALAVRPDDALLWNRLGASLANSDRSEEAIEAYHRALQLKPSFVRARYNLGVSSINIGCYKEAAEHLLGALSMHNVEGVDPNDPRHAAVANQSTSILETLKRAFIAMDRRDLLEKVRPGMNLDQFRGEFNF